jgi:hypothetical protein
MSPIDLCPFPFLTTNVTVLLVMPQGRIDEYVPGIIELAVKRLLSAETTKKSLKVLCLEVVRLAAHSR